MKDCLKLASALMLISFLFFGCKGEIQYVDRIVEVEKTYAASVTFEAAEAEGLVNVTMATTTEGAKIYYSTDGTEPSAESTSYSNTVAISEDTIFKAIAVKEGMENSPVSYAKYSVVNKIETKIETKIEEKEVEKIVYTDKVYASPITFTAKDEEYGVSLSLATQTQGAKICYTTDGSTPTAGSTIYTQALKIEANTTVKAIAVKEGIEDSPVSVAAVTIKKITQTNLSGEPLKITLTADVPHENGYTGNKSNTKVTITANITTAGKVKKVVWKKNGSLIAKALLADTEAAAATVSDDNAKWTFDITATDESANGTSYTVAAIDESGREEAEQIVIDNFDFTPPGKVKVTSCNYDKDKSVILLKWTEPSDSDYDHVDISFTSNDGTSNSTASDAESFAKGTANNTFPGIDGAKAYYTYTFVTYDTLGNKGSDYTYKVSLNTTIPEGFEEVIGTTVKGNENWTPSSGVFVSGRSLTIGDLIVCDHEVTRGEFKALMGIDPSNAPTYDKDGNRLTGEAVLNNPVNNVTWYAAIAYCNKLSIKEGLNCAYTVSGITDWENLAYSSIPTSNSTEWNAATCNFEANGYRLPTEAEWEWLARGGDNYTYAGSNTVKDVAWYADNTKGGGGSRDVKTKAANGYGLYDMSGNVFEWCWDWHGDVSSSTGATGPASGWGRVLRGGCFSTSESRCAVSFRDIIKSPSGFDIIYGFRVVRSSSN